jgi:ribosomal protein S18 acetylase RimI-like enzyme
MQLYPLFCSVAATPIWVLYDLYVDSSARRQGVGKLLMNQARELAKSNGSSRIDLETAVDNVNAQALYESLGYEKEVEFFKYSLSLEDH